MVLLGLDDPFKNERNIFVFESCKKIILGKGKLVLK